MDLLPAPLSSSIQAPIAGDPSPASEVHGTKTGARGVSRWDRIDYRPLTYLAVLTAANVWVARILAPALWGWRSGIEALMGWTNAAASLLSQLLAVVGVMFVARLLLRAFSVDSLGALQKLVLFPAGFAVLAMVAIASQVALDPALSMSIASASGLAALAAAPSGLRRPETRAAALTVTAVAVASLLQAIARRLALQASANALTQLYVAARYLATTATVIMAAATVLGIVWLSRGRVRGSWLKLSLFVALLALLGWSAHAGSAPDANSWQILISRSVQQLNRYPRPLLVPAIQSAALLAPLLAATTTLAVARNGALRAAVVLALVAGLDTDLAPLSLALVAAGAIVALEAALHREKNLDRSHDAAA